MANFIFLKKKMFFLYENYFPFSKTAILYGGIAGGAVLLILIVIVVVCMVLRLRRGGGGGGGGGGAANEQNNNNDAGELYFSCIFRKFIFIRSTK